MVDWLIDYLRFYVPLKNISLIWRRHHCRWRAAKFKPMLCAQGLWVSRGLYRATPTVTRGLVFSGDDWLIDWLIIYGFTSRSRIFHLYGDVTIAGEGLQNLGLCSALRAFKQGGIFIVPHLLWHGTSIFPVSSEGPPHLVAFYDTRGDVEDLF